MPPKKPSQRQVFDVVPSARGGWDVKREGGSRAVSHHETKSPAIDDARTRAKGAGLGQVRIHGQDGRIQKEWTYGGDPRRRPG